MSDEQTPEVYPETHVFFLVGTNIAFLSDVDALSFADVYRLSPVKSPTQPLTVLRVPAGYLAPHTKIVYGKMPQHRPAGVRQDDEGKSGKVSKKKSSKA